MSILKFIEKLIVRLNIGIMIMSLGTMIVLGFVQVILRNFFDSGIASADILVRTLVLWVGFSGAVVATKKGRHIAIGALLRFVPSAGRWVVHVLISIATAVVCLVLAYASIKFILFERESGAFLFGNIPVWISEIIIPLTFCFLTYQFFVHAFEAPPADEGDVL